MIDMTAKLGAIPTSSRFPVPLGPDHNGNGAAHAGKKPSHSMNGLNGRASAFSSIRPNNCPLPNVPKVESKGRASLRERAERKNAFIPRPDTAIPGPRAVPPLKNRASSVSSSKPMNRESPIPTPQGPSANAVPPLNGRCSPFRHPRTASPSAWPASFANSRSASPAFPPRFEASPPPLPEIAAKKSAQEASRSSTPAGQPKFCSECGKRRQSSEKVQETREPAAPPSHAAAASPELGEEVEEISGVLPEEGLSEPVVIPQVTINYTSFFNKKEKSVDFPFELRDGLVLRNCEIDTSKESWTCEFTCEPTEDEPLSPHGPLLDNIVCTITLDHHVSEKRLLVATVSTKSSYLKTLDDPEERELTLIQKQGDHLIYLPESRANREYALWGKPNLAITPKGHYLLSFPCDLVPSR